MSVLKISVYLELFFPLTYISRYTFKVGMIEKVPLYIEESFSQRTELIFP